MQRAVTYLYPEQENASSFKVFQDRTNQIKAFYFTRNNIKKVERMESGTSYAVYFLFNEAEQGELPKIYVGKSTNGASRISNHNSNKSFWSHCIMFVTDNNSFDTATIDYLEYYFIKRLKNNGKYLLENVALRDKEPNLSIYDKPTVLSYISQIEFLLSAEGIDFKEYKDIVELGSETVVKKDFYYPNNNNHNAKLSVKDNEFILAKGSIIIGYLESTKNWSDDGAHYRRNKKTVDALLAESKIKPTEDGKYETLINLAFNNPSAPAALITGSSENGWAFFKGIDNIKQ